MRKIRTANLGYPRIGSDRELKKATEGYWKGTSDERSLKETARAIRRANWLIQKEAGVDIIPSNDFSLYDQVLDMAALLGAVPERFEWAGPRVNLDTYFSMARGLEEKEGVGRRTAPAMEMTKWFDTNYHYIVPEFRKGQTLKLATEKPFEEYREALELGIRTRPVLIGPVTFLKVGKVKGDPFSVLDLLDPVLEVYGDIVKRLGELGAGTVQMDEPALVLDLSSEEKESFRRAYAFFTSAAPAVRLMLTTYFGGMEDNLELVQALPVAGVHVDLVRGSYSLKEVDRRVSRDKILSLGVVDGRNIWKTDAGSVIDKLAPVIQRSPREEWIIAPSCSLIHVPLDLNSEKKLDEEIRSWMAFAKQKLEELRLIKTALSRDLDVALDALQANRAQVESKRKSRRIHAPEVKKRLDQIRPQDLKRKSPYAKRREMQREKLNLPLYPTTTIGSFPQTQDVRQARLRYRKKELSEQDYLAFIRRKIKEAIAKQAEIGLDIFVHGEFERSDMVEYFGEMLEGFAFTENGWVQSYGSRYVKPPIIYGDVRRRGPMTVEWFRYAQSLTDRPVKGMLTGPMTILQWSFVRDDQPRSVTAHEIALAMRDEVKDLEAAGAKIIQIDEPAMREGLPLRKARWKEYLDWAVEAFRLASSGVEDATQIHTHMCYGEFHDIIKSIAELDADVISIETSRSQMELLDVFGRFRYPNAIGPGVYDIHSPRVPRPEEIGALLTRAGKVIPPEKLWVNPDCGLKTRTWDETVKALTNMVESAKVLRNLHGSPVKN